MGMFRKLFSFSKKEIDQIFSHAGLRKKQHGFKLLQVSFDTLSEEVQKTLIPGKLLIITPRSCGKAHERNLITSASLAQQRGPSTLPRAASYRRTQG